MIKAIDISKGMNNVADVHLMNDGYAEKITCLYLDESGVWKDIHKAKELLNLSETHFANAVRVAKWKPYALPTSCIDDYVYVVINTDGRVMLVWRTVATPESWGTKTVFTGVNYSAYVYTLDATQFLFVDGINGKRAKRIVIETDGSIVGSDMGSTPPTTRPIFENVVLTSERDVGTRIKRGHCLAICYTYVNDREEESNPSPTLILDSVQRQARGHFSKDGEIYYYPVTGGEYVYTQELTGSIDSILLTIPIDSASVKRVNIYLSDVNGVETIAPLAEMRLALSRPIYGSPDTKSISVNVPLSDLEVSHDNNISTKGDTITLVDGVTYIGNSVQGTPLIDSAKRIWELRIFNANKYNYVNRFITIDLYDEYGTRPNDALFLKGLDWDDQDMDKIRLYDDDMITPLEVYHYPLDSVIQLHRPVTASCDATAASVYVPSSGANKLFLKAKQAGTVGNSLTVSSGVIPTQASIAFANDGYILLESVGDNYNMVVTIVSVNPSQSLDMNIDTSVPEICSIKISPETDAGGNILSTLGDIVGIISGYQNYDKYVTIVDQSSDTSALLLSQPTIYAKSPLLAYAEKISTNTLLMLPYDSETGLFTSRFIDVHNAIISSQDVDIVSEIVEGTEYGAIFEPFTQARLSGGTGSASAQKNNVFCRCLSMIRGCVIPSNIEKTLYLVEHKEDPKNEGRFIELTDSFAGDNQININDFYREKLIHNPIQDIDTVVVSQMHEIEGANYPGGDIDTRMRNAANIFDKLWDDESGGQEPHGVSLITTGIPDPFLRTIATLYTYSLDQETAPHVRRIRTNNKFTETGTMWCRWILKVPGSVMIAPMLKVVEGGVAASADADAIGAIMRMSNSVGGGGLYTVEVDVYISSQHSLRIGSFSISIPDGMYPVPCGMVVSWRRGTAFGDKTQYTVAILINNTLKFFHHTLEFHSVDMNKDMLLVHSVKDGYYGEEIYPHWLGLRLNSYVENEWQALSILRFMPFYPTDGIGAYNEFGLIGTNQIGFMNSNVDIGVMQISSDIRPGRVTWGSQYSRSAMNEININENVLALASVRSFQPSDEHNTVLIFTPDNVYMLSLLGMNAEDYRLLKFISGIGIANKYAICATHSGIVWLSDHGLMEISANGVANISKGIMDMTNISTITYDGEHNWIWARGTDSGKDICFVFQCDERVWWEYRGAVMPDDFIGGVKDRAWVSYTDKKVYEHGNDSNGGNNTIRTKAIMPLGKKIGRIKAISSMSSASYSLSAKLYGENIEKSITSSTVTAYTNRKTAIPGLSADYIQLILSDIRDVITIQTEQ
ncbi:MAG TPA: hypothetical protein P5092_16785 [Ruminococcus sp.]|nr:hypothetical protein [Ruminococcus sp.]